MTLESVHCRRDTNYLIITVLSFLLFTPFLARNRFVYTPNQGTNREKNFNHFKYEGKIPTPVGKKHLSVHFFPYGPRLFHLSTEMHIEVVIPAPIQKLIM